MTYLELVNNILRRLRERTVSTVNETAYSTLIGVLINDAKSEVENAWNWSGLRETVTLTTANNTFAYTLVGTGNNFSVLDVVNETGDYFMEYRTQHEFNRFYLNQAPPSGNPRYYNFNGISEEEATYGDAKVDVYPKPNGVYTIYFNIIKRSSDLKENSDRLKVPSLPVALLAYAKAIEERGEDGGASANTAYATAARVLNDAMAQDAHRHTEELEWVV